MSKFDDPAGATGERMYREQMKPGLEYKRANLDALREPVKVALLDAFLARCEHAIYGDYSGDAARREIEEFNELRKWANPSVESSWDEIVGGPLPKMLRDGGYTHNDALQILGQARKRDVGRPEELLAIEALEMSLAGKTILEIADALCNYPMHTREEPRHRHKYTDSCYERFRKAIENSRVIYEKYKLR